MAAGSSLLASKPAAKSQGGGEVEPRARVAVEYQKQRDLNINKGDGGGGGPRRWKDEELAKDTLEALSLKWEK